MRAFAALLLVPLCCPLAAGGDEADEAWRKEVAALKPAEQAKAVEARLRKLNFQFSGGVQFKADGDRLVAVGNFDTVGGVQRHQFLMLDTSGPSAQVANFRSTFYHSPCSQSFTSISVFAAGVQPDALRTI